MNFKDAVSEYNELYPDNALDESAAAHFFNWGLMAGIDRADELAAKLREELCVDKLVKLS